jgi:3-hydroxyacyl-CoA dehydrogenase / enoyl-CoA hydratase / 3-hydroxybutyryl-CoA epimerase
MSEVNYILDQSTKIAAFVIDTAGPVNTIGQRFIADLEKAVDRAQRDSVQGVIISSAKKTSFLDGANLKEFLADATPQAVRSMTMRFQEIMASLARSQFPVAAILDGQTALGGGFELLLWACDRVFTTRASKFGLPETSVGLFPAGGGTHALPKVIGFRAALENILTGRVGGAEDYANNAFLTILPSDQLPSVATKWIQDNQGIKNRNYDHAYEEPLNISKEEKDKAIAEARKRHGISPFRPYLIAALDSMKAGLNLSFEEAARQDLDLFAPLFENNNSRNKIDLFFLVTSLGPKLAKVDKRQAVPIKKIAVIGVGLMGRGIAQVVADKGIPTLLLDVDEITAQTAVRNIETALDALVNKGRWSSKRKESLMSKLSWSADYSQIKDIPLVIECVFEDLNLKRDILGKVHKANPEAIFASNTSTIPMAEISQGSDHPELVVGMHFFSPVPLMPLLEVIEGPMSSPAALATSVLLGREMGKTVILVGDGPGFYTSRTFGAYVMNGFRLAELGLSPWDIDFIALKAGFPQGPLHVYGTAGGQVVYHAGNFMASRLPERMSVPASVERMFNAGFTGVGKPSFYLNERNMTPNEAALEHIVPARGLPTPTLEEACDILLLGMVNEAFWCLSQGVLRDYYSMDLGAVLGIGFPDCWHGPARYASQRGITNVRARLDHLMTKFEMPILKPAPEFDRLMACGLDSSLI